MAYILEHAIQCYSKVNDLNILSTASDREQIRKSIALISNILDECNEQSSSDELFLFGLAYLGKFDYGKAEKCFITALEKYRPEDSLLLKAYSKALFTIFKTFIKSGNLEWVKKETFKCFDITTSYHNLSSAIDTSIRENKIDILDYFVNHLNEVQMSEMIKPILIFYLSQGNLDYIDELYTKCSANDHIKISVSNFEMETICSLVEDYLEENSYSNESIEKINQMLDNWGIEKTDELNDILKPF